MRSTIALLVGLFIACHQGQEVETTGPSPKEADAARPARPAAPAPAAALVGVGWSLRTLGGQPADVGNRGKPLTIRFEPGGVANGFSGCNSYSAKYTSTSSAIRFEAVTLTRMACTRGMTLEREYIAALDRVDQWRVASGRLELIASGEPIATFEPE